jgi:16S rRNA (uracil1498-N3)-methyltransferase
LLPTVTETVTYGEMLRRAAEADLILFCYEGQGTQPLKSLLRDKISALPTDRSPTVAVVIGSEGGFSPAEADRARQAGACMAGLGPRILRTETASCFVLSSLVYEFEL